MNSKENNFNPYISKIYDKNPKYSEGRENKCLTEKRKRSFSEPVKIVQTKSKNFVSKTNSYQINSEFSNRANHGINELSLDIRNEGGPNNPCADQHLQPSPHQQLSLFRAPTSLKNKHAEQQLKNKCGFYPDCEESNVAKHEKKNENSSRNKKYEVLLGDIYRNPDKDLYVRNRDDRHNYVLEIHRNKINYNKPKDISDYPKVLQSKRNNNIVEKVHCSGYDTPPVDASRKDNNAKHIEVSRKHNSFFKVPSNTIDRKSQEDIHSQMYSKTYEVPNSNRYSKSQEVEVKKHYSDKPGNPILVKSSNKPFIGHRNFQNTNFVQLITPVTKSKFPPQFTNMYDIKPDSTKIPGVSPNYNVSLIICNERYDKYHRNHKELPSHGLQGENIQSHLQTNHSSAQLKTDAISNDYEKPENKTYSNYKAMTFQTNVYFDKENSAKYGRMPTDQPNKARGGPQLDKNSNFAGNDYFNPYKKIYSQSNLQEKIVQEENKKCELVMGDSPSKTEVPRSLGSHYDLLQYGELSSSRLKHSKKYFLPDDGETIVNTSEEYGIPIHPSVITKSTEGSKIIDPIKQLNQRRFKYKKSNGPFPDYILPRNLVPVKLPLAKESDSPIFVQKAYTLYIGSY